MHVHACVCKSLCVRECACVEAGVDMNMLECKRSNSPTLTLKLKSAVVTEDEEIAPHTTDGLVDAHLS